MPTYLSTDVTGPRCFDCGESLASTVRTGCVGYAHPAGREDHGPRVASMPATTAPTAPPSAHIVDEGGHLAVYVDRHDGRSRHLAGTTPTGRYAAYDEARARGWAAGLAAARAMAGRYVSDPAVLLRDGVPYSGS